MRWDNILKPIVTFTLISVWVAFWLAAVWLNDWRLKPIESRSSLAVFALANAIVSLFHLGLFVSPGFRSRVLRPGIEIDGGLRFQAGVMAVAFGFMAAVAAISAVSLNQIP